jgi:hypothetical protein
LILIIKKKKKKKKRKGTRVGRSKKRKGCLQQKVEKGWSISSLFCVHCSTTQSPLRSSPSILLVRGDVDAALSNTRKLKNLSWIYPFLIFFGFFVVLIIVDIYHFIIGVDLAD